MRRLVTRRHFRHSIDSQNMLRFSESAATGAERANVKVHRTAPHAALAIRIGFLHDSLFLRGLRVPLYDGTAVHDTGRKPSPHGQNLKNFEIRPRFDVNSQTTFICRAALLWKKHECWINSSCA
jgi:hypothetical protein